MLCVPSLMFLLYFLKDQLYVPNSPCFLCWKTTQMSLIFKFLINLCFNRGASEPAMHVFVGTSKCWFCMKITLECVVLLTIKLKFMVKTGTAVNMLTTICILQRTAAKPFYYFSFFASCVCCQVFTGSTSN